MEVVLILVVTGVIILAIKIAMTNSALLPPESPLSRHPDTFTMKW